MSVKEEMFEAGCAVAAKFCTANGIMHPKLERLNPSQRNYHIGTCAYYRPHTIHIMVEKCASLGKAGRAWSWPGYTIDRTPYGVIQHELGHHVDAVKTEWGGQLFSKSVWELSKEPPLTGYLGTDKNADTFYKEWFAEHFRLFVTNPDLSKAIAPRFYNEMRSSSMEPVIKTSWMHTLAVDNSAPERITDMALKKVLAASAQHKL